LRNQQVSQILFKTAVHSRVYKDRSLVPIQSQTDTFHLITSCLFKVYFNNIHTSTTRNLNFSLLEVFPTE